MLPYLAKDASGVAPFDCVACQNEDNPSVGYMPIEVRRSWHCGWIDREEWTAYALEGSMFDDGFWLEPGKPCDICPGYLGQLPQVKEAADATWALRKNVLETYWPHASSLLLDAAKELDAAYSQYEAKRMAEATAKT